jgi:cytochrome c biogenesis protein CcdA
MLFLVMGMVIALLDATIMNNQMGISVMVNGQQQETVTPAMRVMTILSMIIFAAISYFPLYFLFLFSRKMKRALAANLQQDLNEAFLQMKKYFRYCGIIVIFGLLLFGLVFVLTALFTANV